jgi:hypothetical protein
MHFRAPIACYKLTTSGRDCGLAAATLVHPSTLPAESSFGELTNNTARIACGEYALWNVSSDNASSADKGSASDVDAGKNQRATTDPNV